MLSSKEIYNENAKGFSSKGLLNKQQNSSDARTPGWLRTAIKKKFNGNVVLGSLLVPTECTHCFEILDFNLQQNLLWRNVFSLNH